MKHLAAALSLFPLASATPVKPTGICNALGDTMFAGYGVYGDEEYDEDMAVLGYYAGAISADLGAARRPAPRRGMRAAPRMRAAPHAMVHATGVPPLPYPPEVAARMFNPAPGAPSHQAGLRPLTLLNSSFVNGGATNLPFSQTPRHQFQGRQLTYTERRTGAAGIFVSVDSFAIGGNLQFEAAGAIGADTFLQNSFERDMKLTPCSPGVFITGNIIASAAPAAMENILFSVSLHGEVLY